VSFKSFSQIDTIKKIVVSNDIARKIAKDLVEGDACKEKSFLKDKEIENFKSIIKAKDSIILSQNNYIEKSNKVLNIKSRIITHLYIGTQFEKLDIYHQYLVGNLNFDYKKIQTGIWSFLDRNGSIRYGLLLQYRVF
jgi:hypothetical protein